MNSTDQRLPALDDCAYVDANKANGQPAVIHPSPDDPGAWNRFVAANTGGSHYHLFDWGRINFDHFGHEFIPLTATRGGGIVGTLPLVLVRSRLFGKILCSMPFVNFGGPCANEPGVATQLVARAKQLADERGVDYLELRCVDPLPHEVEPSLRKVSVTIDLEADPQKLWDAFSSKHRNNIRRVMKNDIAVRSGGQECLDVFYALLRESWRSLGTPLYAKQYFADVLRTFPDTRLFIAECRGVPVAGAFNGYFGETVEGMWLGASARARELQVNYVLYWEMIKDACLRGFKHYHLGRSTAESGGEQFKSKWNAKVTQLHWYFHRPSGGPPPALNVDNPKYRLAIRLWKSLPYGVVDFLGPRIAPFIP